jgi:hypothetical protein
MRVLISSNMQWQNLTLAVSFTSIGGALFMYRVLYMCCQGKPWNSPPTLFSWKYPICVAGVAILITATNSPGYECSDSACSKNYSYFNALIFVGIFMAAFPVLLYVCVQLPRQSQVNDPMEQPEPPQPKLDPVTGDDLRPALAGYDILFLMIGIGIFLTYASLNACKCP